MKKIVYSLLMVLMFSGCANVETYNLKYADSGKTLKLALGDMVNVELPENPTTGYSWAFFTNPEPQNIITNITESYRQYNVAENMVGVGGIKIFSFKATHPGKVTVTGYYYRPWENMSESYVSKVVYNIVVKKPLTHQGE